MRRKSLFENQLKAWRRVNGVGQKELAFQLGVTQQAVSNWERGIDAPSAKLLSRMKDLFTDEDSLRIEKAFIKNQSTIRALIDIDGVKLIGYSLGFERVWSEFCNLYEVSLEDKLINEIQWVSANRELRKAVLANEIPILSGISDKHFDVPQGEAFKHRWHICFRRYGFRLVADMIYEPCSIDSLTGIDLILKVDEI